MYVIFLFILFSEQQIMSGKRKSKFTFTKDFKRKKKGKIKIQKNKITKYIKISKKYIKTKKTVSKIPFNHKSLHIKKLRKIKYKNSEYINEKKEKENIWINVWWDKCPKPWVIKGIYQWGRLKYLIHAVFGFKINQVYCNTIKQSINLSLFQGNRFIDYIPYKEPYVINISIHHNKQNIWRLPSIINKMELYGVEIDKLQLFGF